jgi:DNA-binding CsgD family transcriptional regulator
MFGTAKIIIPPHLRTLFAASMQQENANKLYILSFFTIATYWLLFILDYTRWHNNELFHNAISTLIFYWHLIAFIFQIPYMLVIYHIKGVRNQTFRHTDLLLNVYMIGFVISLTARSLLALADRGSYLFFIILQFSIAFIFLVPSLKRVLLTVLPMFAMLVLVVCLRQTLHSTHIVVFFFEIIFAAIIAFILATMQYRNFGLRFLDKISIEEKTNEIAAQQALLTVQNTELATFGTEQLALNKTLQAQQVLLNEQAVLLADERNKLLTETAAQSRQLTSFALQMTDRNRVLQDIKTQLNEIQALLSPTQKKDINKVIRFVQHNTEQTEDWERFKLFFEHTSPHFFTHLYEHYPDLSKNDYRLLALLALQLSTKDIATILAISVASVNTARYRLRRRLSMESDTDLSLFAQSLAQRKA